MENKSFRRFLEAKSANTKVKRQRGRIAWEEEIIKSRQSFSSFLEFAYSDKPPGDYIYLDRGTAFDVLDRINWMDKKIKSLSRRMKILFMLLIVISLVAAWGWLA